MDYELQHYGVKGMKWGVRRYQNYDGSYTQRGVARYRKAEEDYEKARQKAAQSKAAYKAGTATKSEYRSAKNDVSVKKRKMSNSYEKLKTDKLADEGKKLYQRGKTITDNNRKTFMTEAAIVVGSNVVSAAIANSGRLRLAAISGPTLALGGTAINAMLAAKNVRENKRLRAYYSH